MNASCVLYSFKIVFPTRQVLYTSALSVLKTTFHVRLNNALVIGEEIWYDRERTKEVCISIIQCHTAAAVLQSAVL